MLLFTAYGYAHLHFCTALRGGDSLLFAADTALLGIDKVIAYHCNRFKRIPCYAGRKSRIYPAPKLAVDYLIAFVYLHVEFAFQAAATSTAFCAKILFKIVIVPAPSHVLYCTQQRPVIWHMLRQKQ